MGNDERALRLAAAADRIVGEWSVRSETRRKGRANEWQHRSQTRLGRRKSEDAWAQGWAMTLDQAIDYALGEREPETAIDMDLLSRRQREVAKLVAVGMTNRQIGERLFISERTAEGHIERIRNVLGARSRTGVATWAVGQGLTNQPAAEPGRRKKGRGDRALP